MSIRCGYSNVCKECDIYKLNNGQSEKDCPNFTPVYTGADYRVTLLQSIVDIYSTYSIRQIRSNWKHNSLRYMMGIYGHCANFTNDYDSIWHDAGVIVLIQQHRFKLCSEYERYNAYKLMCKLNLPLDKAMEKDKRKVIAKHRKKLGSALL